MKSVGEKAVAKYGKPDALTKFMVSVVSNKGRADAGKMEDFFAAGYTGSNLVDVTIATGDKIISNYLHNLPRLPIDFPLADEIA